jgi:hypothetical protein
VPRLLHLHDHGSVCSDGVLTAAARDVSALTGNGPCHEAPAPDGAVQHSLAAGIRRTLTGGSNFRCAGSRLGSTFTT